MENKKFIADFTHWEKYVIITDENIVVAVIENASIDKDVDMVKAVCTAIKEHECMSTCELLDDIKYDYDGQTFECELMHNEDDQHDIRSYSVHKTIAYRA